MSRKRLWAKSAAAVLMVLILSALPGCGVLGGKPQDASPGRGPSPEGESVVAVTTVRVSRGSITRILEIGGEVVAENQVNVSADIAGKVSVLLIDVGDAVVKGQRLAMVDPSTPGKEYAESPVAAPISGTVTAQPVRLGDKISSSTSIATIGRLDTLEIQVRVPERFIGQLALGTQAFCSFTAWPGERFPARVVEVSPVVDAASRTLKTTLVLDRPDRRVKAGMYATVGLVVEKRTGVLALPTDCVVSRNGGERKDVVFVVENDRAVQRAVSLGLSGSGMVEVKTGIEEAERVVASGQSLLSHGVRVRVLESGQAEGAR